MPRHYRSKSRRMRRTSRRRTSRRRPMSRRRTSRRVSRRTSRRRTSRRMSRHGGHMGHDLLNVGGRCALQAGQYLVDVGRKAGSNLFQVIRRISAKQSKIAKCALGKKLYTQGQRMIYANCKKRKVSKILRIHKVRRPSSVY